MIYEMFLDEEGKKISKSKGTGVTIDEWLKYAPPETLKLFMFVSPQKAKKLSFDIIPRYVDDYIAYAKQYITAESDDKKFDNPIYHITPDNYDDLKLLVESGISYSLILNLVSACNTDDPTMIWKYIDTFSSCAKNCDFILRMVDGIINYYKDFVHKQYKAPNDSERVAILDLKHSLQKMDPDTTPENIQNELYRIARENNIEMREWFKLLYQVLIGSESGPRFGSFIALYGIQNTINLIDSKMGIVM
jgi:lysyl-tRNA synthetase class 1